MKHVKYVSMARAMGTVPVQDVLDRVFGFVLELVQIKGKSAQNI